MVDKTGNDQFYRLVPYEPTEPRFKVGDRVWIVGASRCGRGYRCGFAGEQGVIDEIKESMTSITIGSKRYNVYIDRLYMFVKNGQPVETCRGRRDWCWFEEEDIRPYFPKLEYRPHELIEEDRWVDRS